MIKLTKINGMTFTLNLDLIETLEEVPDTVITTTAGNKYIVKESIQEIKQQAIDYKQKIIMV